MITSRCNIMLSEKMGASAISACSCALNASAEASKIFKGRFTIKLVYKLLNKLLLLTTHFIEPVFLELLAGLAQFVTEFLLGLVRILVNCRACLDLS